MPQHEATILASSIRTGSGSEIIQPADKWSRMFLFVDVTDLVGTSPGLEVMVCYTDPASGKDFCLWSLGEITATGKQTLEVLGTFPDSLKVTWNVTGTSATFSVGLLGVAG